MRRASTAFLSICALVCGGSLGSAAEAAPSISERRPAPAPVGFDPSGAVRTSAAADDAGGDRWHTIERFTATQVPPPSGLYGQIGLGKAVGFDVRAGSNGLNQPVSLPAGATKVQLVVRASASAEQTVMQYPCNRSPDQSLDGVLRFSDAGGSAPEAVTIAPGDQGPICFSTTSTDGSIQVFVTGYADADPGGASYTDLPDRPVLQEVTTAGPSSTPLIPRTPVTFSAPDVPADASGVALWVSGRSPSGGFVTVYHCSGGPPVAGAMVAGPLFVAVILQVPMITDACIEGFNIRELYVDVAGYYRVGSPGSPLGPPQVRYRPQYPPWFTAVDPVRLFDTRTAGGRVAAHGVHRLDLTGAVPAGATAVTLNVTVTEPAGPGFVTVWACGDERPLASNLNYSAGQTVANAVTVGIGREQELCFSPFTEAHLIADLAGSFQPRVGQGYVPAPSPVRAFDTRDERAPLAGGTVRAQTLAALVPAGATAVVLNVTATDPTAPGYVTVFPCGGPVPLASNLNFEARATVPNLVTVRLPADLTVCFTSPVTTHLFADVAGWFHVDSGSGFVSVTPERLFDTRDGEVRSPAGFESYLEFTTFVEGWVMNVTVTDPAEPGFLTAYPCGQPRPNASNVNYVKGQTVPNLVVAKPGYANRVCFYTHGETHFIADLMGWFIADLSMVAFAPDGFDAG